MTADLLGYGLLLSILVTTFNRGFFSFPSLFLLVALFFILLKLYFQNLIIDLKKLTESLKYVLLITYSLFIYFSGGIYQINLLPVIFIDMLPLFFLPLLYLFIFKSNNNNKYKQIFPLFIFLAITLRFLTIIASPKPVIDVFTLLKEAPQKLLQGKNPYQEVYSPVYQGVITDNFSYWPFSFLLQIPLIILFKDPRILLIIADISGAILIYLIGKKSLQSKLLSLIYLFRPNSLFMIEQSWQTPLFSFLTFMLFISIKKSKNFLTGILLAVIGGIHHYYLILTILTYHLWKNKKTVFVTFLAVFCPVIGIFLLWQPSVFIEKTILFYLQPIDKLKTIPIHLSLNLNTAFYTLTGFDLPTWLTSIILVVITVFLFAKLFSNRKILIRKNLLMIIIFFYFFYFLFRQSFIYYYYYAGSLLIFFTANLFSSEE